MFSLYLEILKDACFQITIHPELRTCLRFMPAKGSTSSKPCVQPFYNTSGIHQSVHSGMDSGLRKKVTGSSMTLMSWRSFLTDDRNKIELFHFLAKLFHFLANKMYEAQMIL